MIAFWKPYSCNTMVAGYVENKNGVYKGS